MSRQRFENAGLVFVARRPDSRSGRADRAREMRSGLPACAVRSGCITPPSDRWPGYGFRPAVAAKHRLAAACALQKHAAFPAQHPFGDLAFAGGLRGRGEERKKRRAIAPAHHALFYRMYRIVMFDCGCMMACSTIRSDLATSALCGRRTAAFETGLYPVLEKAAAAPATMPMASLPPPACTSRSRMRPPKRSRLRKSLVSGRSRASRRLSLLRKPTARIRMPAASASSPAARKKRF